MGKNVAKDGDIRSEITILCHVFSYKIFSDGPQNPASPPRGDSVHTPHRKDAFSVSLATFFSSIVEWENR
jgi:hypothetical protein